MTGMMTRLWMVGFLIVGQISKADPILSAGPDSDPESKPDWGGTKDMSGPVDVGLTSEELNALLTRLASPDSAERTAALDEIIGGAQGAETVFRKALFDGRGLVNAEMKAALKTASVHAGKGEPFLLLRALVAMEPSSGVRGALRMLTLLHALSALNTMAAYKTMIEFSPRHAGVFRQEVGRLICSHGMDAMPALVYGRGSKNSEIHMFAVKWIRDLGDPLMSDQVKIENPRRLAQLLEAYASVNDLSTIDVILSMTNHPSLFVRAAARASIAAFGRNGYWPARRQYENVFGQEPDESMQVEAILSALYKYYDNRRLSESFTLFTKGKEAFKAGHLSEMEKAYREVLKKEPMFPQRGEMAEGFSALADSFDEDDAEKKEAALRMVLRVSDDNTSATYCSAEARLLFLKNAPLRAQGLVAPSLYRRISALDPNSKEAKRISESLNPSEKGKSSLVLKALLVSVSIFVGALLIFFRLRRAV